MTELMNETPCPWATAGIDGHLMGGAIVAPNWTSQGNTHAHPGIERAYGLGIWRTADNAHRAMNESL